MTKLEQSYATGFVTKCAEVGVDPEVLVKVAQAEEKSDPARHLLGGLFGLGGVAAGLNIISPRLRDLAMKYDPGAKPELARKLRDRLYTMKAPAMARTGVTTAFANKQKTIAFLSRIARKGKFSRGKSGALVALLGALGVAVPPVAGYMLGSKLHTLATPEPKSKFQGLIERIKGK